MEEIKITDLVKGQTQFNDGTEKGFEILSQSVRQFGLGRSILVDKNNKVISGNKLLAAAIQVGISKLRIVETYGDELVVVKRMDLDAECKTGCEFALVDNLSSEQNLKWNIDALKKAMNTHWGFDPRIWGSTISWEEKMDIDDFFTELEEDKKQLQKQESVNLYHQASLFDAFEEEQL